jgi:FtsH-binding integral membrane protein
MPDKKDWSPAWVLLIGALAFGIFRVLEPQNPPAFTFGQCLAPMLAGLILAAIIKLFARASRFWVTTVCAGAIVLALQLVGTSVRVEHDAGANPFDRFDPPAQQPSKP